MLWSSIHIFVLTVFARLLGAHLGEHRDLQNCGFLVLALQRPGTQQIATFLCPGAPTDCYFPAPVRPEKMYVGPVCIHGRYWPRGAGSMTDLVAARRRLCRA